MKKIKYLLVSVPLATYYFLLPTEVLAHCPLCVVGAGAGLTLSRLLGIDDTITGLWLGAFLGALSFWFTTSLARKKALFKSKVIEFISYVLFIALTILSFYQFNLIERHIAIAGFDKLPFGMVVGGVSFYLVSKVTIKRYFPYQRIVVSLLSMTTLSVLFYILLNFYI